jgi:hypothetical protein
MEMTSFLALEPVDSVVVYDSFELRKELANSEIKADKLVSLFFISYYVT